LEALSVTPIDLKTWKEREDAANPWRFLRRIDEKFSEVDTGKLMPAFSQDHQNYGFSPLREKLYTRNRILIESMQNTVENVLF
jgi:hypothetical protein